MVQIAPFNFQHAYISIPDFYMILHHFIWWGDKSYISHKAPVHPVGLFDGGSKLKL